MLPELTTTATKGGADQTQVEAAIKEEIGMNTARARTLAAAAAAGAIALCGCGSVIVEHDVKADIAIRDGAGRLLPSGEIVTLGKTPNMSISFPWKQYRGAELEWTFGSLGGTFENRTAAVLCLQYDQVQLWSSQHADPIPLKVYQWNLERGGTWTVSGKGKDFPPVVPPPLCLQPKEAVLVSFAAELRELFPSGHMFNASEPQRGDLSIADKGTGNWIAMRLPYTVGGEQRIMNVKLTSTDAKARVSYY